MKESVDIRPVKKGECDAPDEPTYDSIKARVCVEVQSWEARVQGLGPRVRSVGIRLENSGIGVRCEGRRIESGEEHLGRR